MITTSMGGGGFKICVSVGTLYRRVYYQAKKTCIVCSSK